ncbi:hypothetical protein KKHLCK_07655 [Candidatus Electrothrix laxa]
MKTDMSPQAVTARLKKTSELRRLCIALGGDRLQKKLRNADTLTGQIQQDPKRKP